MEKEGNKTEVDVHADKAFSKTVKIYLFDDGLGTISRLKFMHSSSDN